MHFVREIWLRHVKCAAARGGFISFHVATKWQYFTIFSRKLFHIRRKPNISLERILILCYNNSKKGGENMRKHKPEPMPFNLAIVMLLIGILLGSVFTFGMQYWNAKTTREACTVVETQFLSYDEIWHAKPTISIVEIAVDCADGNRYLLTVYLSTMN